MKMPLAVIASREGRVSSRLLSELTRARLWKRCAWVWKRVERAGESARKAHVHVRTCAQMPHGQHVPSKRRELSELPLL